MPPSAELLPGSRFGLIADAHIHPGRPLPEPIAALFAGADGILVLGDMGEASGLDALAEFAPVTGVVGGDDPADDKRLVGEVALFEIGGLSVGAVFDPTDHGLFTRSEPLAVGADFDEAMRRVFGRRLDVLVCGSTHKACVASASGVLIVNPGSPTLSDQPSVAVLQVADGVARVEPFRLSAG